LGRDKISILLFYNSTKFFPFRFNLSVAGKFIERISLQSGKGIPDAGAVPVILVYRNFRDTS
jgi:hypothetical protein